MSEVKIQLSEMQVLAVNIARRKLSKGSGMHMYNHMAYDSCSNDDKDGTYGKSYIATIVLRNTRPGWNNDTMKCDLFLKDFPSKVWKEILLPLRSQIVD